MKTAPVQFAIAVLLFSTSVLVTVSCGGSGGGSVTSVSAVPKTKAQLGHDLFFDTTLSSPKGMSCATCHSPTKSFTDPRTGTPTSPGAVKGMFGFRNAPSASYASFTPNFQLIPGTGAIGGQFWDGRATDLQAQAELPLLNPIEMNNASAAAVVETVKYGPSAKAMQQIYGAKVFDNPTAAFNAIADAIATFENTPQFSPFTSKYDYYLKGKANLTAAESRGLTVFNGQGLCFSCHPSAPGAGGTPPLFTNHTYDNLGIPRNPNNPYYKIPSSQNPLGSKFVDLGLQRFTGRATDAGLFKTPTLRNVAVTAPYFHNGIYNTLQEVVDFYNNRDSGSFGQPEVPSTEDTHSLGNLKLTPQQESDLVAFLETLTDGYTP